MWMMDKESGYDRTFIWISMDWIENRLHLHLNFQQKSRESKLEYLLISEVFPKTQISTS